MDIPRTIHLYNLGHFLPLSPILAAHSVTSDTYDSEHAVKAHPGKTHCANCGIMLVPGLTASTRIKYTKKTSGSSTAGPSMRSRTLVVTCGQCGHEHEVCSLVNQRKAPAPAAATDKKKKKKKKNSELSAMLASRKKDAPKTLSLFEFMQ